MLLYLFCNKSHYENVPFEIPENWCWTTINDIAFVTKLAGFEYTKYIADNISKNDGIPLFKGKNVLNGEVVYEFESYIPRHISNELFRSQISKKCLLTPYVGTIGNIGIHNKEGIYHLGSNVGKIELFNGLCVNVYEEYVKFYLLSSYGYKELTKQKKATAQESISIEAIREVLIPLPPVAEQLRIVNEIDNKLSYIKEISKDCGKISELIGVAKSKILELAISGKLVPQDPNDEPAIELLKRINPDFQPCDNSHYENIEFDIPQNWVWATIGDIFEHNTGKALNASNPNGTMLDYITTSNLYWDRFELSVIKQMPFTESEIERCIVRKGDLLICEGGDVGRAAIWDYDYNIMIQNHIHRLRGKVDICTRYFFYLFMHYKLHNLIGGKGVAIQGLSSRDLHNLIIPVPSLKEQYDIASSIDLYFSKLDMITAEL